MNELDSLRQEAETLKNAIRVSAFLLRKIKHLFKKNRTFAEKRRLLYCCLCAVLYSLFSGKN